MDDYQTYGRNAPADINQSDPVGCALNGPDGVNNLFVCGQNRQRIVLGFTEAMMAQRCASTWDGYCDMYLKQELQADYTNKKARDFIRDTLLRMFCQNDTSVPGYHCYERCQMYNPTSSSSFSVCQTQGDIVFRDSNKLEANSTDFNQAYQLNTAQPIRISKCPKVCNLLKAENLTDKNVALNIALDNGIAMDLIQNLIVNIVSQKMQDQVTNSRLNRFMEEYVQDGSFKPGLYNLGYGPQMSSRPIAMPAVNPYIPPNQVYVVNDKEAITGNTLITATNASANSNTMGNNTYPTYGVPQYPLPPQADAQPTPIAPEDMPVTPTDVPSVKENFAYIELCSGSSTDKTLVMSILGISIITIAIILYMKVNKK